MFAGRGRIGGGERVAMYLVESYHDYFIRNFVKIFFRIYLFAFVRYSIYKSICSLTIPIRIIFTNGRNLARSRKTM